jgi:cell division protein FtsI (penicillin-binding protein 3)/stage V sporulation protein D (sporulation-specific penicillin-binding protein)
VAKRSFYFAQAESQYAALDPQASRRGTIYFTEKDGTPTPAAVNKNFPVIYAVPKAIEDVQETANQAAELLARPASELIESFSRKNSSYVLLDKKPSSELADKVKTAGIKGLYVEEVSRRFYPFTTLGAHVVGFVGPNPDDNGQSGKYGVERFKNDMLSGHASEFRGLWSPDGGRGEDIVLTIDPAIQAEGEHLVKDLVNDFRAKSGSFIVMDPATGRIWGMGSYPTFDPNSYAGYEVRNFLNPSIEKVYEPGSVFKVLTMAAGIDTGKITPDTTFYDSGELKLNGKTIKNWDLKAHGMVTMTQVIQGSLNTGAAFAERQTGHAIFRNYLENFGFGRPTGVDLPGELAGDLSTLRADAPDINFATASFGQGVNATPLQVVRAIAAIANGGKLMKPILDSSISPVIERDVITADTAKQVAGMMVAAVDKAAVASISGYSIAGKTGTAQVPDFVHGGYTDDVIDTYVGFPAANPKFIVLIKIEEPAGAPHAAETVVPVFRKMAQFLLNYFEVPPDRI